MSLARHFEVLGRYQAMATRVVPVDGEPEDLVDEGGGLARAFEAVGQGPLVSILRDPLVAEIMLADGDLEVSLKREGAGGRLAVRFAGTPAVDEWVEIPPLEAAWRGAWFRPDANSKVELDAGLAGRLPLFAVQDIGGVRYYQSGTFGRGVGALPLLASVPELGPEHLGDATFMEAHGVRWAYVAGAMAGGIASASLVIAMARSGLLGFYGAGGVPVAAVEEALAEISAAVEPNQAWGANLLHNPIEPAVEEQTVDLYLKYGVRKVSASAYMGLTPAVVRYRVSGIHLSEDGRVVCPNRVFAKVSRPEVAEKFLRPAPASMLQELVKRGAITEEQAAMAATVPIATDITAEADSGGHTDHRPLVVLVPEILALRDAIQAEMNYREVPRVGAAGGLGTPAAVWGAFALGADYVLTGSVNQATKEAGTSDRTKNMLAEARFYDVASGPAPDMFEIGAKVQVLSRGSMYAQRAQRLYDVYKTAPSLEEIPAKERARLEKQLFKRPLAEVWEGTRDYWQQRDPAQVEKAERDPKHKMALTFRWYLGMTSRWARTGDDDRKRDFQIWCGPAMGAFNYWSQGLDLAGPTERSVVEVAELLMQGAAVHARRAHLQLQGVRG